MNFPESKFGRVDRAGLAMTLLRTFGVEARPLVEEQVVATVSQPALHARWCGIRDALAVLSDVNAHMETALYLLDEIEETRVAPMLDHAIVQLGLRDSAGKAIGLDMTVRACSSAWLADKAQHHLDLAQSCTDPAKKASHLNTASHYAAAREQIDRSIIE